jgi:hypothetical protein
MVQGHIVRTLPLTRSSDFPIIQYAADTLLTVPADGEHLSYLKGLFHRFGEVSGLKVSYSKSNLIPINIQPDSI